MKFLVDESAGASVAEYLRSVGHDVTAVATVMPKADDPDILGRATGEERIVVTNDKGFGDLVFRSGMGINGVLLLRLRDESAANRVRVVRSVLERYGDRLPGHFTTATEWSVRIRPARPLPDR